MLIHNSYLQRFDTSKHGQFKVFQITIHMNKADFAQPVALGFLSDIRFLKEIGCLVATNVTLFWYVLLQRCNNRGQDDFEGIVLQDGNAFDD